jgi:hypothetical protein
MKPIETMLRWFRNATHGARQASAQAFLNVQKSKEKPPFVATPEK